MCHSRGAHVACTHTYIGQGARKKIRPRMYIRVGYRMPTRAYVRPGLVYMAGSERRNNIVVMFMGSQPSGSERNVSSCSSGGLGRNSQWKRGWRTTERGKRPCVRPATVKTGSCSSGWSGVPQNGGNRPPTVETGVLLIGRGVAYRKTEETDLCWSATVETGVLRSEEHTSELQSR